MESSIVMLTFSVLDWKYHFWVTLLQKKRNCNFKLECRTKADLNMQNSVVKLTFVLEC